MSDWGKLLTTRSSGRTFHAWMLSLLFCCATPGVLPASMCLALAKVDLSTRGETLPEDETPLRDLDRLLAAPQRRKVSYRLRPRCHLRHDSLAQVPHAAPPATTQALQLSWFPLRC